MKKTSRFGFLLLPGIFTSSHGYGEMFRLLSGSLTARLFIGIILFGSVFLGNAALLMMGSEGLFIHLFIGFIIKDSIILMSCVVVALVYFSRWRKKYSALEDLAITPLPRELIPGLVQRSLLRKAFFLLVVNFVLEAIFATAIAVFTMQREASALPLTIGYYLFLSIPLIWFHYHTIYLVITHFSRLAVRSADAMRTILSAILLLAVETVIIFFVGTVATGLWISLWVQLIDHIDWLGDLFESLIWDESILLLFTIVAILLPGLLICGCLKALCSMLFQKSFVKTLINHLYNESI